MIFVYALAFGTLALVLDLLLGLGGNSYTIYLLGTTYGILMYMNDKLDDIKKGIEK